MNVGARTQITAIRMQTVITSMDRSTALVKWALLEMELHAKVDISNSIQTGVHTATFNLKNVI